MSRPKSKRTIAAELVAKKTGLSVKYIVELNRAGMPLEPLAAALAWLEARPSADDAGDDSSSTSALRRERIKLVKIQSAKLQQDMEITRGKYIHRDVCAEAFTQLAASINALCRKLEADLPPAVLGLNLSKSMPIAKALIREIQAKFSAGASEFWNNHPERDL